MIKKETNTSKKGIEVKVANELRQDEQEELLEREEDEARKSLKKSPEEELKALLAAKEAESAENYDRLLRTQAEFENYKKRIEREKADTIKFCNEEIIKELLPVIDNLEMALEHSEKSDNSKSLIEGIEMVLSQFLKSLEKFGVSCFSSIGELFDPNCHEAMSQIESDKHDENTVVSEFQKGYYLNDRLLRPAKVMVAKLPSKSNPENEHPADTDLYNTN
ncbi:MAG: nucleotide exchange factor GrpE [Thermodesulfobacteriota bacterium]|nr:nucleotide exchange factor GrpE [Thermodesulfobacteriota bacterium]